MQTDRGAYTSTIALPWFKPSRIVLSTTNAPVTITGQCGNDVAVALKGDIERPDKVKIVAAMLHYVSIECSK